MLIIVDQPTRRRRSAPVPAITPTPTALTLVAANAGYVETLFVVLTFDRAVDIAAFEPAAIVVDGNEFWTLYGGTSGSLLSPTELRVDTTPIGPGTGALSLTASAETGIVAVDDGGTWAGVEALGLPYP